VTGLPLAAGTYYTSGSEVKTWGGGVVQNIEAAAMDLYLIYSHVDGEFTAVNTGIGIATKIDVDNMDLVQGGAMIKFSTYSTPLTYPGREGATPKGVALLCGFRGDLAPYCRLNFVVAAVQHGVSITPLGQTYTRP
jgi:hypothetical protein